MKLLDKINLLIDFYRNIEREEVSVFNESTILSKLRSEQKWQDLTDEEKQAKRVGIIKKVSLRLTEDRKDTFLLEETVNLVYSLCDETIKKIDNHDLDELLTRLKAMLSVEKILINEHFEAKRIRSFNYRELDNILNEIIKSDQHQKFSEGLNLGLLKEKVYLKYQLLNTPEKPLT